MKNYISNIIVILLAIMTGILFYVVKGSITNDQFYTVDTRRVDLDGVYLRLIYIGSSDCIYCDDKIDDKIKKIKDQIITQSLDQHNYIFTGISVDSDANRGYNFLQQSGIYDEMIIGGGWSNLGVIKYVWSDLEHIPVTPQLLITRSKIDVKHLDAGIGNLERSETILIRLDNYSDILNFIETEEIPKILFQF